MYVYCFPLDTTQAAPGIAAVNGGVVQVPTHDGGLEHTEAKFLPAQAWLERAQAGEVILFPPQFFLMYLMTQFLKPNPTSNAELQEQRERLVEFIKSGRPTWMEKCISPKVLLRLDDGRHALSLESPGPELDGSDRKGDSHYVVAVQYKKEGPRHIDIKTRSEVFAQARQDKRLNQKGLKL